jgi:hypothetical protein
MRPERRRKSKESEPSEVGASLIQSHPDGAFSSHRPSCDEIRLRAYEIYLERGGLPGDEIDDWVAMLRRLMQVEKYFMQITHSGCTPNANLAVTRRKKASRPMKKNTDQQL